MSKEKSAIWDCKESRFIPGVGMGHYGQEIKGDSKIINNLIKQDLAKDKTKSKKAKE